MQMPQTFALIFKKYDPSEKVMLILDLLPTKLQLMQLGFEMNGNNLT